MSNVKFITDEDIDNMLGYHPANTEEIRNKHETVRHMFRELAHALNDLLPESPEKTVCIRQKLRESMMYANAAIAVHGSPLEESSATS